MVNINLKDLFIITDSSLKSNGISNHYMESMWLIERYFNVCHKDIILNKQICTSDSNYKLFISKIELRKTGYPFQYIIGDCVFYGRNYVVGEGVLIPRPDTEALCDLVINLSKYYNYKSIVDLCSGTGCIAITLKNNLHKTDIYAVEKSKIAFDYLLKNININECKITALNDDIFDCSLDRMFDVLVCNPPYVSYKDKEFLQKELRFEPEIALFANDDGLYYYKKISCDWKKYINPGGLIAFEIGINQYNDVSNILSIYGYRNICYYKDAYGIIRVVYGFR